MYDSNENTSSSQHLPWNEQRAQLTALEDGIGFLSDEHWRVIHHLREHFVKYGSIPPMRVACHESHLGHDCVESLFLDAHEAVRIAGLPLPGEEANVYL